MAAIQQNKRVEMNATVKYIASRHEWMNNYQGIQYTPVTNNNGTIITYNANNITITSPNILPNCSKVSWTIKTHQVPSTTSKDTE